MKARGRRFSRREVIAPGLERLDWADYWGTQTLARHERHARSILERSGINVDRLLADAPHGSNVLEYVLNRYERDSLQGLAARILECSLHARAYMQMKGGEKVLPDHAYRLGRLTLLLKVYETIKHAGHDKGGRMTGKQKKRAKISRETRLLTAALAIRSGDPRISTRELAQTLSDRGHGGKEYLRRKLGKLLPQKALG
jgi:hypothetical protein